MEKKTKVTKKPIARATKLPQAKVAIKKKTSFTVEVFDISGKSVDQIELSKSVFGVKPNQDLISQAVLVYLANQRQGRADTKVRGEVRGGGRKPWRQKGTGRARIGSTRAPHWRGGGVVHGPTPRDFSLSLPKKMKKAALISALSIKFSAAEILVLRDLKFKEAKTKQGALLLKNLNIENQSNVIVSSSFAETEKRVLKNLDKTKMKRAVDLNVYEVLNNKKLLITKTGLEEIENLVKGKQ